MTTDLSKMIDRDHCVSNNIDPKGNKWAIFKVNGTALYQVEVEEGNKQVAKPERLLGRFTKPSLAQEELTKFITERWDDSDQEAQKLARRNHKQKVEEQSAADTR